MIKIKIALHLLLLITSVFISCCTLLNNQGQANDQDIHTQAAGTVSANLTAEAPKPTSTHTHTPRPPRPSRTPTTTSSSTPTATAQTLLVDDFSKVSGWGIKSTDNFSYGYAAGGYRINVETPFTTVWSTRQLDLKNVRLEVSVQQINGPENGFFGLICRQQIDGYNYYVFVANSFGFYAIGKVVDGTLEFILQENNSTNFVLSERSTNRIGAHCVGDYLTLFVNGNQLAEIQDNTFVSGFVGLVAGIEGMGRDLEVIFDDFMVNEP